MAYLIVHLHDEEVDRRALVERVTVGRAPTCGLSVRDIQLSRVHCAFEPVGDGWRICDLGSKNGTFVDGRRISEPTVVAEASVIRVGRTTVLFRAGAFEAARVVPRQRPADPVEALAGTMVGFVYAEVGQDEPQNQVGLPAPRPAPPLPASYLREDLQTMLSEIASSSWDSIYAEASRPMRPVERDRMKFNRPRRPAAPSLQLQVDLDSATGPLPRKPLARPVMPVPRISLELPTAPGAPRGVARQSRATRAWRRVHRGLSRLVARVYVGMFF